MTLKHLTIYIHILTILSLTILASSCNDNNGTTYSVEDGSSDAQIYSFSLSQGYRSNAIDSITYPALPTTKFAIDQRNNIIYNPDSLPYLTRRANFLPTISFGNNTGAKLEVVFTNYVDSIITWKSSDSINFADMPLEFKVTSPNGKETKIYNFKLNIHQIDPDTIDWKLAPSIPKGAGASQHKTLVVGNEIYVYVLQGANVKLYMSNAKNVNWSAPATVTGLPSDVKLGSMLRFRGKSYAVDGTGKAYKSEDAITWSPTSNPDKIYNILGILPEKTEAKDSLLVVTEKSGKYYFGKTMDMKIVKIATQKNSMVSNEVVSDFPADGFSSAHNINRNLAAQNLLMISGGKTFEGEQAADTWIITTGRDNLLEVGPAYYNNNMFKVKDDFKTFLYDNSLYALTNDSLYISKWGVRWSKAPKKQNLKPAMKTVNDMSVVVDESDYIWIVASKGSAYEVWRGRLNRLRK